MNAHEYNLEVAHTLKAIRELSRKSQKDIAKILQMDQSNYCKIERGEHSISLGQLFILTKELKTSVFQLLAIVEAKNKIEHNPTSLSSLLIEFIKTCDGNKDRPDIEKLISLIRDSFELTNF